MLATELSSSFAPHPDLQNTAVDVISECLVSNRRSHLPETVFTRLKQTRADFALTLLQRLLTAKCATQKIRDLLSTVWETIVDLETTFESALTSGDASYSRTLLKMLFLALRVHSEGDQATDNMPAPERKLAEQTKISTLSSTLDILDRVVAKGFRDLATALHEHPKAISPDDIALITAILQSCLRVPGIETRHPQIQSLMAHYDATRVATTLFSWSDKLAIDGDPIYGELSVLFLLELSTIPSIAEQLAVEGVLGYVSSSSLTNYLRRNNVSPFAESAGAQRCYSIWARGILPLLLNLLAAVGPSIASEVALFLNQFPNLLKLSSEAFEAPDSSKRMKTNNKDSMVTLLAATEVHSLSLILLVLNSFRETQPQVPQISWDAPTVLENVDFWLGSRPVLRDMILPLTEREVELANKRLQSSTLGCQNKLEEKIVDELMGIREVLNGGEN
jgi:nuclear pore complex protein Nup188